MKSYIVDAFTDRVFGGNPAGVCILAQWPEDALMQNIAIENNLSETAFAVPEAEGYRLRWFTPGGEIDLCGHATLATAFVLATFYAPDATAFTFHTRGGTLAVEKKDALFEMDFPNWAPRAVPLTDAMRLCAGTALDGAFLREDLLLLAPSAEAVRSAAPDFALMQSLPEGLGVILTAPGEGEADFVSRCFYPKLKVNEDPVTGRAHCSLIPFWAERLQKETLFARQVSPRGGALHCRLCGERVKIAGRAVLYAQSELFL